MCFKKIRRKSHEFFNLNQKKIVDVRQKHVKKMKKKERQNIHQHLYFVLMPEWIDEHLLHHSFNIEEHINYWNKYAKTSKYPKDEIEAMNIVKQEILTFVKEDKKEENITNLCEKMKQMIYRSSENQFYSFYQILLQYEWMSREKMHSMYIYKIWKKEQKFFLHFLKFCQDGALKNLRFPLFYQMDGKKLSSWKLIWLVITNERRKLMLRFIFKNQFSLDFRYTTIPQEIKNWSTALCIQQEADFLSWRLFNSLEWVKRGHSIFQLNLPSYGFNIFKPHIRIESLLVFYHLPKKLNIEIINLILEYIFNL